VAHSVKGKWGAWVIAKVNIPEVLTHELELLARDCKLEGAAVFMSSATDPYQGIERRLGLSRGALAALAQRPPYRILLQTRSPLVERDIDLLGRLGRHVITSTTLETDERVSGTHLLQPSRRSLGDSTVRASRALPAFSLKSW